MNRKALLVCVSAVVLLVIAMTAWANAPRATGSADPAELPYAPDRILIQVKSSSMAQMNVRLQPQSAAPGITLGIASLDAVSRQLGVTRIARPFIEPANTAEAARLGVERWMMVSLAPGTDVMDAVRAYAADPNVEHANPDYRAYLSVVPTDPAYPQHWGHNNTAQLPGLDWGGTYDHTLPTTVGTPGFDTNAQPGWDGSAGFGSSTVIIAIVDTGVNLSHPDLTLVAGWDYGDNDSNPEDNSAAQGHGTSCSGVAAAKVNNGLGACGAAPGCRVMPLKVANSAGSLFFSAIVNAIYHAADNGAHVISMSFGANITSEPSTDAAITYAFNAGVTLLAATGNENRTTISYPANNPNVIGVGAASPCGDRKRSSNLTSELNPGVFADPNGYTCDGERWWGSNYGSTTQNASGAVDIIAPTILYTTDIQGAGGYRPGDYEPYFNGTSCSTPYAAGVCALIKSKNPTFTPAQVKAQLTSTAQDIQNVESAAGWDRYSGFGMIDINGAVGGGGCSPLVTANFSGTPTSGTAPLSVSFSDLSTGSPTGWSWNFGDGGTSTVQNPSHVYSAAGTYNVTLTASNACGSDAEVKNGYVTVTGGGTTWVTVSSDNFEINFGSFTDGGQDCARYTGGTFSHQGVASANIQDNTASSMFTTTTARNVSAYNTQEVSFWFRAQSMETGESFQVQYFNGSVYQTVGTFTSGTSFANGTFNQVTITLRKASIAFPTNARLRFQCSASANNDDVYIDEIVWRATTDVLQVVEDPVLVAAPAKPEREASMAPRAPGEAFVTGLDQNYPNPFNPRTTIAYRLAAEGRVVLDVFDVAGRKVATLVDGVKAAGRHTVDFEASSFTSGVYFYRLSAGGVVEQRKMVLLK